MPSRRKILTRSRIDETLDMLNKSTVFSLLDLATSYWQVGMHPADKDKTAFISMQGLFEFNTMPFGLCNAPATMQRLMDAVLAGTKWQCCLVYIDDIIIFSPTYEQHIKDVESVLERLERAGLSVKLAKCQFCAHEIPFLGYLVSRNGVKPNPDKVAAVQHFPVPTCVKDVQSFLGLAQYYRKFIHGFSSIARPLGRTYREDGRMEMDSKGARSVRHVEE